MQYLILLGSFVILAVWVFFDARGRKTNAILWTVGTVLLGPVAIFFYLAMRPLKAGEVRKGGIAWNTLKNFAIFWTVLMSTEVIGWGAFLAMGSFSPVLQAEAKKVSTVLSQLMALGFSVIAVLWLVPALGALFIGLIVRRSSIVEIGPTGPLAAVSAPDEPFAVSETTVKE
jgi:hypothetical protein